MGARALWLLLALVAGGARASDLSLSARTFVERTVPGAGVRLEPLPPRLRSGERVVVIVRAVGASGTGPVRVVQPIPAGLRYFDTGGSPHRVALSVDGGRHFAKLAELSVPDPAGGRRPAASGDVTHLRWTVEHPGGPSPTFSFRGVVR